MVFRSMNPATTPVTSMLTFMQHRQALDEAMADGDGGL